MYTNKYYLTFEHYLRKFFEAFAYLNIQALREIAKPRDKILGSLIKGAEKKMKIYTCNDHEGVWPVPTASVVVAKSKEEARYLLHQELLTRGIIDIDFTVTEVDTDKKHVIVLSDGDY